MAPVNRNLKKIFRCRAIYWKLANCVSFFREKSSGQSSPKDLARKFRRWIFAGNCDLLRVHFHTVANFTPAPAHSHNAADSLAGVLERIIFLNEENHYTIAEFRPEGGGEKVTIVGALPGAQCGETLHLTGQWTRHAQHGDQFKVASFKAELPSSVYGIRKYLGSGLVPGIGKVYANKIVDALGTDTFRVLSEESAKLRKIPGIGKVRAAAIKKAWDDQRALREIHIFLQTYGVTTSQCVKLIERYQGGAMTILKMEPYRVAREIDGIGFKTADRIAINLGFANDAPPRLDAGLLFAMDELQEEGHTAVREADLVEYAAGLLEAHTDLLAARVANLVATGQLVAHEGSGTGWPGGTGVPPVGLSGMGVLPMRASFESAHCTRSTGGTPVPLDPHGRDARATQSTQSAPTTPPYTRADRHRTLLIAHFSEIYSPFLPPLLGLMGYDAVCLPPSNAESIDYGLKYANNEVCYPATLVVGDIVRALNSGKYKSSEIAICISQTGGQCRASNYIALIKKALIASGHADVPVVSIGTNARAVNNTQPGFELKWRGNIRIIIAGMLYADRIAQMYYATAPRERTHPDSTPAAAARLRDAYIRAGVACVSARDTDGLLRLTAEAAADFNALCDHERRVPRIGIVGEIYVKYNSIGNKNIINWIIDQGAEAVVPSIAAFFLQEFPNHRVNIAGNLKRRPAIPFLDTLAYAYIQRQVRKFNRAASGFAYFHAPRDSFAEAESASRIVNLAGQYGEGWLIPAELASFAECGVLNAVSLQPFGCIANHLVSKGIEKRIRDLYPDMSLLFLDLDSGASEANMLNRLHFMLQNARTQAERADARAEPELACA